jgi:hypothetical protein
LVGGVVLKKKLIDGLVEEWDDDQGAFVVVETLGRVTTNEIVSIKYTGDKQGAKYEYPTFAVSRKPAKTAPLSNGSAQNADDGDDSIPF